MDSFSQQFFNMHYQKVTNSVPSKPGCEISQEQLLSAVCVGLVGGYASTYKKQNGLVKPFPGGEYKTLCDGEVETTAHCAVSGFLVSNPQRPKEAFPMSFEKASTQFTQLNGSPLTPDYSGEVIRNGTGIILPISATSFKTSDFHTAPASWGKDCEPVKMNDWLVVNCFNPDEVYCIPDTDIKSGATILTGTACAEKAHSIIAQMNEKQEMSISRTPSISRTSSISRTPSITRTSSISRTSSA